MTGRQRRRAPPKPEAEYRPGQLLDWTSSAHWDYDGPRPCRYCGFPTQLLDRGRHHAHKVCAESALAIQAAEAADAYHQNGQTRS
ncbi:hypothetical protein [Streptomyces sp. NBC_00258]|uniref:hypothetical protein n=1 Tax=Streptomyces sp. NBC_00258 TaxID=2903642 RepID=UPI002E27CB66|nr:hypothetical protein [Streptomyces sp. NBC_00258]